MRDSNRSVKRLFRGTSRSGDRRILRNINKRIALIVSQNTRGESLFLRQKRSNLCLPKVTSFFYPSRSRGSPKRACRALGVPVGLAYHRRTKCGVYHQGRRAALVSHHAPACIFLRLDDIQCSALMIYRNKLRMIYTPYGVIWMRDCGKYLKYFAKYDIIPLKGVILWLKTIY